VSVRALSAVYGSAATLRRRWYAARPSRVRRLSRPVISVGNLCVGGSGKTPTVACLARLLLARGEHPAILSRGYGRRDSSPGVTVVSDRAGVRALLACSGDEPLLLARMLPGVPVLVCADRYRAGLDAESHHGATVHILDDGFQHVRLARAVDLLLVDETDLSDRVLPSGRLREPLANAAAADAVIMPGATAMRARAVADQLGVRDVFTAVRTLGPPAALGAAPVPLPEGTPLFAVAGIARPQRFLDDLEAAGHQIVGSRVFRDHHPFTQADVVAVAAEARVRGARAVVTTEKDAVRLVDLDLSEMPWLSVPLVTRLEPADAFAAWLTGRLAQARAQEAR